MATDRCEAWTLRGKRCGAKAKIQIAGVGYCRRHANSKMHADAAWEDQMAQWRR